jgi:hypothetical protein
MRNILHKTIRQTGINRFEKGNVIMKKSMYFLILNFTFLIFTCSQNPSKPPEPVLQTRDTLTVSIEQVTHRSVSLRLTKKLKVKNDRYVLTRISGPDTLSYVIFPLSSADTLIIDDNEGQGLALDSEYSYFAYRIDSVGIARDTSATITAKTLAATSHDFTWTEYTLGSGELYDVWGTDENNVYAVGGVETDSGRYSIIHWDGTEWRGIAPEVGGSSIFGFSESDIWVAGGGVAYYDGFNWQWIDHYSQNSQSFPLDQVLYDNTPYRSIWGTSSANLYFAGREGKIVHWDGEKAEVVYQVNNSSIDIFYNDLDGLNGNYIIGVGYDFTPPSIAIKYDGLSWQNLNNVDQTAGLLGVCVINQNESYFAGSGVHHLYKNTFSKVATFGYFLNNLDCDKTTGELVAVGDFGGVMIYNGLIWKDFKGIASNSDGWFFGAYIVNGHVFCVGRSENSKALITIGLRK